jgi:hypothetical protein
VAKTAYLVKRRPRAPSRMEMEELAEQLAFLAGPPVSKALRVESLGAAAVWQAEAIGALGPLLRDADALASSEGGQLLHALEQGLERSPAVSREEIREHAAQTGRAIASTWLQFLAVALGDDKELALDESLLPAHRARVRPDLWQALEQSLTAFALDFKAVPKILQAFADGFVHGGAGLRLPFGLTLKVGTPYLLQRSPPKGTKASKIKD